MLPEEKREYYRKNVAGREQLKKKALRRQKKRRKRLFLCAEIVVLGICSFLAGKSAGAKQTQERISVSVTDEDILYQEVPETEVERLERDSSQEGLLLVNKDNPLPEDYTVTLLTLPDGVNRAAEEAYEPLCSMLEAGRREGLNFEICSSYRDQERQKELFDEDVNALMRAGYSYQEAYQEVAKETMPPGCSEHSSGLAFDIVSLGYQMLDEGQERTEENKWLQQHCAEYGFILRYPEGKEEITQISYESWHFRYVGVEAAEYIMEHGITLEEYLEL